MGILEDKRYADIYIECYKVGQGSSPSPIQTDAEIQKEAGISKREFFLSSLAPRWASCAVSH